MFKYLGFTEEDAKAQFGFLMDAFQFGSTAHGGLAFDWIDSLLFWVVKRLLGLYCVP
jgi:aspartyl-tRNA synthetase